MTRWLLAFVCLFGIPLSGLPFLYAAELQPPSLSTDPFFLLPDIQKIKDRGSLIVAQKDGENPPFFFVEKNQIPGVTDAMRTVTHDGVTIAGADIEIAKILADTLGVKLDLRRGYASSRAVVDAVATGAADLGASGLRITFDRIQKVRFSEPYAVLSYALLVNRHAALPGGIEFTDKSPIEEFDRVFNRQDCRIGVEFHSPAAEQLPLLFPRATAVSYASDETLAELLLEHKVDAILNDDFDFLFAMVVRPEQNLYFRILKIPDSPERVALAVNPELPTLASLADEAARAIRSDSAKELFKEYGAILHSFATRASSKPTWVTKRQQTQVTHLPAADPQEPISPPMPGISLAAIGTLAFPLLVFLAFWLLLAKRRSYGICKN